MKTRIGTKLMLWAALGGLAVVSVVSFAAYRIARAGLEEQIMFHLQSVAQSRAAHVETLLDEHREVIQVAATSITLEDGLRSLEGNSADRPSFVRELNARLVRFLRMQENVYEIFLLNRDGKIVASTIPGHIGLDTSTDSCFVGARDGSFVKDAHRSATTGRDSFGISAPIFDREGGDLLGVLVAWITLGELNSIVADRTGLGKTGETYLINKDGFMITPSRVQEDTFLKQKVDTQNARQGLADVGATSRDTAVKAHTQHRALVFPNYRGVRVLGTHAAVPEMKWVLLAEIDAAQAFAPIATLKKTLSVFAVLLAAAALAMAHVFARRIVAPIRWLHHGAERVGTGELAYRLDIKTGDEIEQLADEFNRMASRLSESYASLEQKVADRTAELTREIAERKQAQEVLRESEAKHRTLVENLPQKIFLKDKNSVYVSCNENYARDLKIRPDEITGKTDHDFYPKELAEKYRADDRRIMASAATEDLEEPYIQDGREVWVHTVKTPLKDQNGNAAGILGIFWDITERKQAEEEIERHAERLKSLNAELERSNRDLQDFTYTVSHDLQEPLRKIHTFGQFLVEDCGDRLPEDGRQHLRRMQDAAVRMKELIQHLLALARVGTHGGELVPVESGEVVNAAIDTLSETVRDCGAEIAVAEKLPTVMADAVQLGQVFQNLIGNALKFRLPDRSPKVTISGRVEGDEAIFSVTDNGIGIEERFLEKVFGVFQRLYPREQYEGAGVGLALCGKIVRRHGGRIWAESEPGKGSTFRFTLRRVRMTKEEKP